MKINTLSLTETTVCCWCHGEKTMANQKRGVRDKSCIPMCNQAPFHCGWNWEPFE